MPVESHLLMDGTLHVYRREGSRFWQWYLLNPPV